MTLYLCIFPQSSLFINYKAYYTLQLTELTTLENVWLIKFTVLLSGLPFTEIEL